MAWRRGVSLTHCVRVPARAQGGIHTADGGRSVLASAVRRWHARITTIHQREFPNVPNPNKADVVNTAVAAMARVKGTARPYECDAL